MDNGLYKRIYARGLVNKLGGYFRKRWKDRYMIMNSDNILYYIDEESYKSKKAPRGIIEIYDIEIMDNNQLKFVAVDDSKSILIKCSNEQELNKWIEAFENWKNENKIVQQQYINQSKVNWIDASSCMLCTKPFGFLNRKHHCRACGAVVCNPCSAARAKVPELGFDTLVRLCDLCYESKILGQKTSTRKNTISSLKRARPFCQVEDCGCLAIKEALCEIHLKRLTEDEDHGLENEDETSEKISCNICQMMIPSNSAFCTECGFSQQNQETVKNSTLKLNKTKSNNLNEKSANNITSSSTNNKKTSSTNNNKTSSANNNKKSSANKNNVQLTSSKEERKEKEYKLFKVAVSKRAEIWAKKNEDETNINDVKSHERMVFAIRWVDKELRKLVTAIKQFGKSNNGVISVKYGDLFESTQDIFEALSGTLMTAKKRNIVDYEGQLLLQRVHDDVEIFLLEEEVVDSKIPEKREKVIPTVSGVTSGFENIDTNVKEICAVCKKQVYLLERVAAASQVFHKKTCFKCCVCNSTLNVNSFCCVDKRLYCSIHYNEKFKSSGGKY